MKKVIKNRMFLVIIITIIVTSVSVYAATTYKATDVIYKASDGTSMNVNDALNELYNKSNNTGYPDIKIYYDSGWGGGTCQAFANFNIPKGYNYLEVIPPYVSSEHSSSMEGKIISLNQKINVSEKDSVRVNVYNEATSGACRANGTIVLSH